MSNTAPQTMISPTWGELTFFPAAKTSTKCGKCILMRYPQECDKALCSPEERSDKADGYWAIHNMPNPRQ